MAGLSVVSLISVPARTLVSPANVTVLPLRLSTTGGGGGGAPAAPGRATMGGPPPAPGARLPGAATVRRPTSPLHTAAFRSA